MHQYHEWKIADFLYRLNLMFQVTAGHLYLIIDTPSLTDDRTIFVPYSAFCVATRGKNEHKKQKRLNDDKLCDS